MNGYKLLVVTACGLLLAGAAPALADMADVESAEKIETEAKVELGYRGVSAHGSPGRALEFDSLEPSPTFKAKLFSDRGPYHIDFGIDYLNEDDFAAEAHLNTIGLLRLDLRSQRFFHNLDHIPYDNGYTSPALYPDPPAPQLPSGTSLPRSLTGTTAQGSRPDAYFPTTDMGTVIGATRPPAPAEEIEVPVGLRAFYTDHDPGDDYGRRIDINEAKLKIKCPDYPAHVTLSYWRYEKEGSKQQRFVSEGGDANCTGCHMQSRTRNIDRVTEEFKAGVDAHAGFVDIVLEGLLREFRDHEPVPVDDFGRHSSRGPRTAGEYEHDEDPDSRLKEITLRLNTAPSGGFVASGAFTLGERENKSELTSLAPVKAETDYYRASGDVTYTPGEHWTFSLRYRLLDMDSDNSGAIDDLTGQAFPEMAVTGLLPVRASMDITRAWYEAIASWRPSHHLTLKAELRREDIERSQTGEATPHSYNGTGTAITSINTNWNLPDEETITRLKLGFSSRLLEKSALKLSGWVAFQHDDNPAYGASLEEGEELFLTASYAPSPVWGVTTSINLLSQENNEHAFEDFELTRDKDQQNFSLGSWINPREGLSFDLNYGYFRTAIDQDLLFGAGIPVRDDSVEYRQSVQTVTAGVTWQALDNLACRLEGYHIRSKASYSPDFPDDIVDDYVYRSGPNLYYFSGPVSSSDLSDISRVDIVQNGLRGRVNWQIDEHLSCSFEATLDDYDERNSSVYDGSVQTYLASLSYTF